MSYKVFSGYLGAKPEVKAFNGKFVMNFDIAERGTTEHPDGSSTGSDIWYRCSYWSANREYLDTRANLLEKGMKLLVCGSYYSESYPHKDAPTFGVNHVLNVTDFALDLTRVESITLAPKKGTSQQGAPAQNSPDQQQQNGQSPSDNAPSNPPSTEGQGQSEANFEEAPI